MKYILILLTFSCNLLAQQKISGLILDKTSGKPVSFASLGIVGKQVGTLSDENGVFELILAADQTKDTLKVYAIGYKPQVFYSQDLIKEVNNKISLEALPTQLAEVVVKSKKIKYKTLGTTKYSKNNCSGFVKNTNNWKGSESALKIDNKDGRQVLMETFSFYIIQNKYADSLTFRLMFYEAADTKWQYPSTRPFMKKPIIFKVGQKNGQFVLNIKEYGVYTSKDFYVSLECLMDEMEITKFCYAGSYDSPSFVKAAAFSKWTQLRGGGPDFNVKVSYTD
ncbi:MAG: carboxypeptidase-like regulatory domain-containing protein [Bacteroidetes bacterium]|nr:carboxypeptidase-like regulatory domain-containing protein [Bacteroidota bacterium]